MGWLFAVALGLQERSRRAVLRALVPIAVGHEASIALVVLLVSGAQLVAAPQLLRGLGAATLIGFGLYKLLKPRSHPRWVSMRVNGRQLTLWSFLMSTAHGAGLMVAPVLLGLQDAASASAHVGAHDRADVGMAAHVPLISGGVGITLHVAAMLVVMGAVAIVVYDKLGVEVLRRAWLNTDQVWAAAFIVAAVFTLFT